MIASALAGKVAGLGVVGQGFGGIAGSGQFGPATPGTKTAGVQEAIDAVATTGGGLVQILPGTYPVSNPVCFRSMVTVVGYGATLVNGANLAAPFVSADNAVLTGGRIMGLTLDGAGVANQTVLTLTSAQHCNIEIRVIRAGPGSTGVRLTASSNAQPVDQIATTACSRSVYSFDIDDCATGLLLQGIDTRPVTNNSFPSLFVTRCTGVGVNILEHGDNNHFGRVHVQLIADKAVGFSIGSRGQGTGSNHNIVVKLTVDSYKPRDCFALVLNSSRGNHIVNVLTSGQGFAKIVQAAPGAQFFTVFNATDMVRYEAVVPSEYPKG
jgi:hypothetical protein